MKKINIITKEFYESICEVKLFESMHSKKITVKEKVEEVLEELEKQRIINNVNYNPSENYVDMNYEFVSKEKKYRFYLWAKNYDYQKPNKNGVGGNYHLVPLVGQIVKIEDEPKLSLLDMMENGMLVPPATNSGNKTMVNNMPYIFLNKSTQEICETIETLIGSENLNNRDNYVLQAKSGEELVHVGNMASETIAKVKRNYNVEKKLISGKCECRHFKYLVTEIEEYSIYSPLSYNEDQICHKLIRK